MWIGPKYHNLTATGQLERMNTTKKVLQTDLFCHCYFKKFPNFFRKEPLKLSRSQSGELRLSLDRLDDTSEFSATQDGLTNRQPFRGEANRPKSFPEANGSKNYPVAKTDAKSDTGKWSFLSMFRRKKNDDLKENGLKSESK